VDCSATNGVAGMSALIRLTGGDDDDGPADADLLQAFKIESLDFPRKRAGTRAFKMRLAGLERFWSGFEQTAETLR